MKLSGATGGTPPAPPGGKWCSNCNRSTQNTSDCWGICKWCGGKGHQAEKCRFKKDVEAKEAEIKAKKAAEARKKKKAKNKAIKKKKNEGAHKAVVDLPGTAGTATGPDTSSSSEEQSPFYETGTRSKRVNFQGAAKKTTVFCYPSLGDIHEAVEGIPEETVREQFLKACTAKTSESSPVMKGIVSKHKNCQPGSQERLLANTGCSFPIINSQIVHKLNIKVRPFNHPINIIEASGNSLNLEGSARLFIKIPQALGDQVYPVEAAVLSGSETDSELSISLYLLIEWNLVPKNFLQCKIG